MLVTGINIGNGIRPLTVLVLYLTYCFRYLAINKPAVVLHWLNHIQTDAECIIILDVDMIMRGPVIPWEFGAQEDLVVAAPYEYVSSSNEGSCIFFLNY